VYARVSNFPGRHIAVAGITHYNFRGEGLGEPAFFGFVNDALPAALAGAGCP